MNKIADAADALRKASELNPRAAAYHYVASGVYRRLARLRESQDEMDTFRRLEREAADFEQKRRDARKLADSR